MKSNLRLSGPISRDYRGDGQMQLVYPLLISLFLHLALLLLFVFTPNLGFEKPRAQSVINVSMVSFQGPAKGSAPESAAPPVAAKAPVVEKPAVVQPPSVTPPTPKAPALVDPPVPRPKTSLKKKTFQSTEVVKRAIEQLEGRVADTRDAPPQEAAEPEPLQSVLERLRQTVGQTEVARAGSGSGAGAAGSTQGTGTARGTAGGGGGRKAELIDLYRLEVAFQIQKNWAFNEQLAGGDHSLAAAIVFKVMPDGEIRDIFFTDRSGNAHLDESAYRAIVKSSPVGHHPSGLAQPYVVTAIRFTPKGIR